jgi:hypothetical protein
MYRLEELVQSCKVLFGPSLAVDQQFLISLDQPALKGAYRKKALATHPDRFLHLADNQQACQVHAFREVNEAYQKLTSYLGLRSGDNRRRRIVTEEEPRFRETGRERVWTPPDAENSRIYDPSRVPAWRVKTGEYLYFSGVVNWKVLISSLVWQRNQREALGQIAARWGWLTDNQILALLNDRKLGERIGEVLLRHRLVNPFQLAMLLRHQERTQKPLGRYFVEQGHFSDLELLRYLEDLKKHNLRWTKPSFGFENSGFGTTSAA